jgi:hypothetical protein
MPRRNVDGSSWAGSPFHLRPPSGSSRHRCINPFSNTMLARSETGGTSSEQSGGERTKTRCLYPSRILGPACQPASIGVTALGSTEIPIKGNTSSDVYRQPRRKTTRKQKKKFLPSSNGKRIDPSGGVSTMFLGSRAVGRALRFRFHKKMGGLWSIHLKTICRMPSGQISIVNGSTLRRRHPCAQEICMGCLGTTPYPTFQGPFWQVPMSILLTLTRQQGRYLRNVPGFDY